jgi:hypothetical protein
MGEPSGFQAIWRGIAAILFATASGFFFGGLIPQSLDYSPLPIMLCALGSGTLMAAYLFARRLRL